MTTFLIYGSKGWIGQKVVNILKDDENIQLILGNCRCDNEEELENEIRLIKPTHVISLIGRTRGNYFGEEINNTDYLEKPGKLTENIRDNLFSPVTLAILSLKHNFHFTYVGTGCIFSYDNDHPDGFDEDDKPNFFNSNYSLVKGYTDRLMHLFENTVLNIRIRMSLTDTVDKRNFIIKFINYEKVCSVSNSMSVLDELLPIMISMSKDNVTGTINLTNPGLISPNEILEMYKEIIDPDFKWKNFTIEEQKEILLSERSNNFLNTNKLEEYTSSKGLSLMNIKDSVRSTLMRMKEKL